MLDQPREDDGKFGSKVGLAPEIDLNSLHLRDDIIDYAAEKYGVKHGTLEEGDTVAERYRTEYLLVQRTADMPPYDGRRPYWEMVAETKDPERTADELAQIALNQSEDDFYVAVARSENADALTLDHVARHNNFAVRRAVIEHKSTDPSTLRRLSIEGNQAAFDAKNNPENYGPMKHQYEWEEEQANQLSALAKEALAARG